MIIFATIPGYPRIELSVVTPITEATKLRQEGITFTIRPTPTKDEYHVTASKGQLLLNSFMIKDKV